MQCGKKMSSKKRSFTVAFKLEAVEFALQNSSEGAARKYNVDSKRIREWRRQKVKLLELSNQQIERKRLKGGGRHVFNERMEEKLADWVRENRNNKVHVSRKTIQQEAQRLHNELEGTSGQKFTASRGWLQRFLERNEFVSNKSIRSHKEPDKIASKLVQFVLNLRQSQITNNYQLHNVIIMDEVLCTFENNSDEKLRFTVCLAAKGDGTKLMPYIVFVSHLEGNAEKDIKGVVVKQNQNGMNPMLMIDWLQQIIGFKTEKRLLVWDSNGYHFNHETVQEARNCNIDLIAIPGGCSKYIHAPQCFWNERLKTKLKDLYNLWIGNGCLGLPAQNIVVQWVVKTWDEFAVSFIANSLKLCAITVANNGSEDDEIQCFKKGESYENGREILKMRNSEMQEKIHSGEMGSIFASEVLDQNDSDIGEEELDDGIADNGVNNFISSDYYIKKE